MRRLPHAPHRQHPHLLVVFLAKHGLGTRRQRVVQGHELRLRFAVAQHLGIDHGFDPVEFVPGHRVAVREVKAQPVRAHVGAFLHDVRSEHFPQGRVEQVGAAVVCGGQTPGRIVDSLAE